MDFYLKAYDIFTDCTSLVMNAVLCYNIHKQKNRHGKRHTVLAGVCKTVKPTYGYKHRSVFRVLYRCGAKLHTVRYTQQMYRSAPLNLFDKAELISLLSNQQAPLLQRRNNLLCYCLHQQPCMLVRTKCSQCYSNTRMWNFPWHWALCL